MVDTATLRVRPPAARLLLQGEQQARNAAATVWGVPFSEASCRAHTAQGRATLWLGPEEHLLWQESREISLPIADLEIALAPFAHSLVDVSHRQTTLELDGPGATLVLAGACPLDLDLQSFPVNMCTRTVLAKAEITLWRTAPQVFRIEVGRSFQTYVVSLLEAITGT